MLLLTEHLLFIKNKIKKKLMKNSGEAAANQKATVPFRIKAPATLYAH